MLRMKVLLVDDYPLYLEGLRNLLVVQGHDVVGIAENYGDAIEMARLRQPDLVMMDAKIPGCDSFETTRRIRSELPGTKVILMTMVDDVDFAAQAVKQGASDCLPKFIRPEALLAILKGSRYECAFHSDCTRLAGSKVT